jgi:hypothetical protein
MMVGAGGQLLERSIVDRMVGAPERLVFEGGPILNPPLAQDRESRRPVPVEGAALDTLATCPPLTIVETAKLHTLKAKQAHQLAPESAKARAAFIAVQTKRLVERTGMSDKAAARAVARQCVGILLPPVLLPFDDHDLAGTTVADVLDDPERFEGATLADPLEGVEYGTCKARIMRRPDGTPWINSFAHGRTTYELKLDAIAAHKILKQTSDDDVLPTFIELALTADLNDSELEGLRNLTAERTGTTKTAVSAALRAAQRRQAMERAEQERNRLVAERLDPRPLIRLPPRMRPGCRKWRRSMRRSPIPAPSTRPPAISTANPHAPAKSPCPTPTRSRAPISRRIDH